jgi:hypothetical protein
MSGIQLQQDVAMLGGAEPMGDDEGGASLDESFDRLDNRRFGTYIERAGG